MPRKSLLELNSVSVRTVLNLRPNERAALNALVQEIGDFPAHVVGELVIRAGLALQAGATWGEVLTALEAAGQLGAARARYGNLAEAQGASPTAGQSESVTGDVTDRPTDRCGGGFA